MQKLFLLLVCSIAAVFAFTLWGLWRTGKLSPYPDISGIPRSAGANQKGLPHNLLKRDVREHPKQDSTKTLKHPNHSRSLKNKGRLHKYKGLKKLPGKVKLSKRLLSLPLSGNQDNGMVVHMDQNGLLQREITTAGKTDGPSTLLAYTQFSTIRRMAVSVHKKNISVKRTNSNQTVKGSLEQNRILTRKPSGRSAERTSPPLYTRSLNDTRSTTRIIAGLIDKQILSVKNIRSKQTQKESKMLGNGTILEKIYGEKTSSLIKKSDGKEKSSPNLKPGEAGYSLANMKHETAKKPINEKESKFIDKSLNQSGNIRASGKLNEGSRSDLVHKSIGKEKRQHNLRSRETASNSEKNKLPKDSKKRNNKKNKNDINKSMNLPKNISKPNNEHVVDKIS